MDDATFDDQIADNMIHILAVKFETTELEKIPSSTFIKFPSALALMASAPGIAAIYMGDLLGATALQFLYLQQNRVTKIMAQAFAGADNLNEINLADNLIDHVSENAFEGLDHLESLGLARNKICSFPQATFTYLLELINLDVSGNAIEFLDARWFVSNEKLHGVNLADNKILTVTNGFLKLLPQIKVLNMMANPCINNTMLEKIPMIKIIDSEAHNSEDDTSLEMCYKSFMKMADPESTDFNDLLSKADVVIEDIEMNIIAELNLELREKDEIIKDMQRREDLLKIALIMLFVFTLFWFTLKMVIHVVNHTASSQVVKKLSYEKIDLEKVEPVKVIYTIEL